MLAIRMIFQRPPITCRVVVAAQCGISALMIASLRYLLRYYVPK
jgi:hypothetical protein